MYNVYDILIFLRQYHNRIPFIGITLYVVRTVVRAIHSKTTEPILIKLCSKRAIWSNLKHNIIVIWIIVDGLQCYYYN